MSFPNIPDINPCINITLEDSVNLLLTSIALEEISLSKLMDAESCKILHILNDCKHTSCDPCHCTHERCMLHDALLVNESVDHTMQNMIKMQMLLQFKLEKVKEIIPSSSATTCTMTHSTSTYSPTAKKSCKCCLSGKGGGCISNICDEFNGHLAVLEVYVCCNDATNRSICYSVEKYGICFCFHASACEVKMECPCKHPNTMLLYGNGRIEKKSRCTDVVSDLATFKLTVCRAKENHLSFKLELTADSNSELSHNSETVQVETPDSTLLLEICRNCNLGKSKP